MERWLEGEDIEKEDERDFLWEAVNEEKESGNFTATRERSQLFVKGIGDKALRIASPKAKAHFLRLVREYPVMDALEEGYRRAVANPHS